MRSSKQFSRWGIDKLSLCIENGQRDTQRAANMPVCQGRKHSIPRGSSGIPSGIPWEACTPAFPSFSTALIWARLGFRSPALISLQGAMEPWSCAGPGQRSVVSVLGMAQAWTLHARCPEPTGKHRHKQLQSVFRERPRWPLTRRLMSNGDKSRVREGVADPGYSLGTDPELRAWGMVMA